MLFKQETYGGMNHAIQNDRYSENTSNQTDNFNEKFMPLWMLSESKNCDWISLISKLASKVPEIDHRCCTNDDLVHANCVVIMLVWLIAHRIEIVALDYV